MTDTHSATRSDRDEGTDLVGAADSTDHSSGADGESTTTQDSPSPENTGTENARAENATTEDATSVEPATTVEEPGSSSNADQAGENNLATDSRVRRYLIGGVLAALISLLILPIAGLVSVYCGYKLLRIDRRSTWLTVSSYALVGVGLFSLVSWVLYLLSL